MRLHAYLKTNKQTYRQFAAEIGEDASQVHRWASGKRIPSLSVAARISSATNGLVTPMDFLPTPESVHAKDPA